MSLPSTAPAPSTPPPPVIPARKAASAGDPATAIELLRLKTHHELTVAVLTEERDNAVAEAAALRKEAAGAHDQVVRERRIAAEFGKKLALCQKELGETGPARAALQAECDGLKAERAVLLAQVTELSVAIAAVAENAVAPEPTDWEARATEQLEADIASYRERIRTLLAERDGLREERDRLAARAGEGAGLS